MATAAFLRAWRSAEMQPALLAKIDLTIPSARTVRLSNRPDLRIEGTHWEYALMDGGAIRAPGDFLTSDPAPCSAEITAANVALGFQAAAKTLHDLSVDFAWEGAAITLYLWEMTLTAFSDACQVFVGVVNRVGIEIETVKILAAESPTWRRPTPPGAFSPSSTAPEQNTGKVEPIIYGDHRARAMPSPWTAAWEFLQDWENAGGGKYVLPCITTDTGSSGTKPRVLIAGHQLYSIPDTDF